MTHPAVWVLRRFVMAPAVVGLAVLVWVTLPVWLLVAAFLAPVLPGRWRALRLLWVALLYLTFEAVALGVKVTAKLFPLSSLHPRSVATRKSATAAGRKRARVGWDLMTDLLRTEWTRRPKGL